VLAQEVTLIAARERLVVKFLTQELPQLGLDAIY